MVNDITTPVFGVLSHFIFFIRTKRFKGVSCVYELCCSCFAYTVPSGMNEFE